MTTREIAITGIIGGAGLFIGTAIGFASASLSPSEVVRTEYRTPQACLDVIDTDNKVIAVIRDNLSPIDYEAIAKGVEALTPSRIAQRDACRESAL